jgi:ribosome modulation factor
MVDAPEISSMDTAALTSRSSDGCPFLRKEIRQRSRKAVRMNRGDQFHGAGAAVGSADAVFEGIGHFMQWPTCAVDAAERMNEVAVPDGRGASRDHCHFDRPLLDGGEPAHDGLL